MDFNIEKIEAIISRIGSCLECSGKKGSRGERARIVINPERIKLEWHRNKASLRVLALKLYSARVLLGFEFEEIKGRISKTGLPSRAKMIFPDSFRSKLPGRFYDNGKKRH